MNIGITGATGKLGRLVIENLKTKIYSQTITALARDPRKAADLSVNIREFDYTKPDLLAASLKDIDRLLLISGNEIGQRARQHANVINAAATAGVPWIVYTSLLHADTSSLNLADEHRTTEAALKASDLSFTILRNGWYTENYTGSVKGALSQGAFLGSAGRGRIASTARADYAAAAAAVLTGEGHQGKTYELAGDEAYTLTDLAAELSRQTGRTIPYKNLPEVEYADILKQAGLPAGFAEALASWDTGAANGDLFDDSGRLSMLVGRPTTPLSRSIAEALAHSR
jgi:NAD(P)H dehydrogenase (quinone)